MSAMAAKYSLIFSSIGHSYSHLFAPIFYVTALSLEGEFSMTHGEVVVLVVVGNMLFGFAAPIAGWLGDRWSVVGMMAVFFIGTGISMVLTGISTSPTYMMLALALTGTFAAIYHPVGISWLIRSTTNTGTALGINGVFGGLGPAVAALMTGAFIDLLGWRFAFVVPGIVIIITGVVFVVCIYRGWVNDNYDAPKKQVASSSRHDVLKVIGVLCFTMLCGGIIYHATQTALPKAFSANFTDIAADNGVFGISVMVAVIYSVAGFCQILGGSMADKYSIKAIYFASFLIQVPMLALAASIGGPVFAIAIFVMVAVNASGLPAENMLIAHYTPVHRRGLVYGLKFVVAIGFASLGTLLEGYLFDLTGEFQAIFFTLAALALAGTIAILILPSEESRNVPAPAE